jgi:hypothetical protein
MGRVGDELPESCDCCGHDADDCNMVERGWVWDTHLLPAGAVFCLDCAHQLRVARHPEWCSWCGQEMTEEERAETLGWAYFADEVGVLHPCCPSCLAGRFGITARVDVRREA